MLRSHWKEAPSRWSYKGSLTHVVIHVLVRMLDRSCHGRHKRVSIEGNLKISVQRMSHNEFDTELSVNRDRKLSTAMKLISGASSSVAPVVKILFVSCRIERVVASQ